MLRKIPPTTTRTGVFYRESCPELSLNQGRTQKNLEEGLTEITPKALRGWGFGRGCSPFPSRLEVLGERRELPSRVRDSANAFSVHFRLSQYAFGKKMQYFCLI